jgi:Leucine-rich repeat (LRR) protein
MTLNLTQKQITSLDKLTLDTKFRSINLYCNQIDNIGALSSLTNLQMLDLGYNKIKDIGGLSSLTNLLTLFLDHNKITKIGGLASLTNLKDLRLMNNQIKDISELNTLTNLQSLGLYNNHIPDWEEKTDRLLQRNKDIQWDVVKPQFIQYCFTLAPLNLPVDIVIMIFDVNSYPNHLYKKWEIGKTIKDAYQRKIEKMNFLLIKIE